MKLYDPARWLTGSGVLLIVLGVVHLIAWPLIGGQWEGAISIRKPILFGLSTGITLVSLGWILRKLKHASYDTALSMIVGPALVIEVGLIAMQFWRGEASHFNHSSSFNGGVDFAITALILVATIAILDMTRRCLTHINATPEMTLAIRAGMVLLVISCGIGFLILGLGEYQSRLGQSPETFGKSGVLKFPHGTAIHAIQLFPVLAWFSVRLGIQQAQRVRIIQFAIAAMSLFLLFSMLQTFRGRTRFDLDVPSGLILIATLLPCLAMANIVVSSTLSRWRAPVASDR